MGNRSSEGRMRCVNFIGKAVLGLSVLALGCEFDDAVAGAGPNQFNYMGTWKMCTGPCASTSTPDLYMRSNHWAGGADAGIGQSVTFSFTGTQLVFHGVKDVHYGIGMISMDGGTEE